ncbi:MAG: ABC transporter substrate-binding protein [Myxococcales bacterium]|nr:ABC transporter substrate-binding protein [Myxococcales bacterium]|tara:strand:- start:1198 stop:2118 length:921 start_codon:yes stop_codon:yes gene_type:complete
MKHIGSTFLFLALILWGSSTANAKLNVVTTTNDLADLVRQIGGPHVKAQSITKPRQDPHYVKAKPSLMVKLRRADLLVSIGLDLETGWLPSLIRGSRNPKIRPGEPGYLKVGGFIKAIGIPTAVDHSHGHVHAHGNPHFWLDPVRIQKLLSTVTKRLMKLDPAHAAEFKARAAALSEKLDAKIQEWTQKMAPYKGTPLVSYHDTFNYFYDRFGLVGVGTLEIKPGVPPSPKHLSRAIQMVKGNDVKVLLHEIYHDERPSKFVAKRTGAKIVFLPTSVGGVREASDYIAFMDVLINNIIASLEPAKE